MAAQKDVALDLPPGLSGFRSVSSLVEEDGTKPPRIIEVTSSPRLTPRSSGDSVSMSASSCVLAMQANEDADAEGGRLARKTVVLVGGGTSMLGASLVASFRRKGARVVIPCAKKSEVASADPLVFTVVVDMKNSEKLRRDVLRLFGPPDHVVAALDWPGELHNAAVTAQSPDDLLAGFNALVMTSFNAARAFCPVMADDPNASYTIVTSLPRVGLHACCMSALYGLAGALRLEFESKAIRINELRIGLYVLKSASSAQSHAVSTETLSNVITTLATAAGVRGQVLTANDRGELSKLAAQLVLASTGKPPSLSSSV